MTFLFWLNLVFAQEETDSSQLWMQLYEGQLSQIIELAPADSIEIYNALLESISSENPIYSDIYYQLALAQFAKGEITKAKSSLEIAKKNNKLANRSGEFYKQLVMWEKAPSKLPYNGNPWVQDSSKTWKAAFSNISPESIGFEISLAVPATLSIRIVDWTNQVWERSVAFPAGKNSFTDKVVNLVPTSSKILSVSVSVESQQVQAGDLQMGELVLR